MTALEMFEQLGYKLMDEDLIWKKYRILYTKDRTAIAFCILLKLTINIHIHTMLNLKQLQLMSIKPLQNKWKNCIGLMRNRNMIRKVIKYGLKIVSTLVLTTMCLYVISRLFGLACAAWMYLLWQICLYVLLCLLCILFMLIHDE